MLVFHRFLMDYKVIQAWGDEPITIGALKDIFPSSSSKKSNLDFFLSVAGRVKDAWYRQAAQVSEIKTEVENAFLGIVWVLSGCAGVDRNVTSWLRSNRTRLAEFLRGWRLERRTTDSSSWHSKEALELCWLKITMLLYSLVYRRNSPSRPLFALDDFSSCHSKEVLKLCWL